MANHLHMNILILLEGSSAAGTVNSFSDPSTLPWPRDNSISGRERRRLFSLHVYLFVLSS